MIESGFFIASVENVKQGIFNKSLDALFYGDGKTESSRNPKARLLSWQVTDSDKEMDSFSFTLDNNDLTLFDSDILAKGNTVMFKYGTPSNMSADFEGVITTRSGWRTITISGKFKAEIAISNTQATEKFTNKTLSEIASELYVREGFIPIVDDTEIRLNVVIKRDETVLQFLKRKAHDAGGAFEAYIEGDTAYFTKKDFDKTPFKTLRYGTERTDADYVTLGEPEFTDEQENIATEEKVKGFDMLEKMPIEEKANNETSNQTSLGSGTYYFDESTGTRKFKEAGNQRSAETGKGKPTSKQKSDEASSQAASTFDKKNANAFKLSWSVLGDASITAKKVIFIDVESDSISGRWYVETVEHSGESGSYNTTLSMTRNALGRAAAGTEGATPSGGNNSKKADESASSKVTYVFDEKLGARVPKRK